MSSEPVYRMVGCTTEQLQAHLKVVASKSAFPNEWHGFVEGEGARSLIGDVGFRADTAWGVLLMVLPRSGCVFRVELVANGFILLNEGVQPEGAEFRVWRGVVMRQ
jgi:hypothetical protein